MTEKLEALFDLPADEKPTETEVVDSMKETVEKLKKQTMALTLSSKIDSSFSSKLISIVIFFACACLIVLLINS